MRRLSTFLFGVVVGGALVFFGQRYHVVRTTSGVELIPKLSAGLVETYVDIRNFQTSDWEKHKSLHAAIVRAKKESILSGAPAAAGAQGTKPAPANPKSPRAI
ncbi:MAG TPA: hypothetical protein VGJ26_20420 [Pirellulales bacterium]|jgi:hypothetical protein